MREWLVPIPVLIPATLFAAGVLHSPYGGWMSLLGGLATGFIWGIASTTGGPQGTKGEGASE